MIENPSGTRSPVEIILGAPVYGTISTLIPSLSKAEASMNWFNTRSDW